MPGRRWWMAMTAVAALAAPASASASGPGLDAAPGEQRITFPLGAPAPAISAPAAQVADLGDFDGDGAGDLATLVGEWDRAQVWVTGSRATAPVSTAGGVGWHGVRIVGGPFQTSAAGVGDLNGDGLADLAIGVNYDKVAVVFGRRDEAMVDVRALGRDDGFVVDVHDLLSDDGGSGTWSGIVMWTIVLRGVGDQNGDGRGDLAYLTADGARVLFTPADAGGRTITDGDGYAIRPAPAPGSHMTTIADLGDLDGDGRDDVGVVWLDGPTGDAVIAGVGSSATASHAVVDPVAATAAGKGFMLRVPRGRVDPAILLGDQNGDGRRDLVVDQDPAPGEVWARPLTVFTPPLGTARAVDAADPAQARYRGYAIEPLFDAGDQDGDGVADLGTLRSVPFTAAGPVPEAYWLAPAPGSGISSGDALLAGALADRNGDGRPELVTLQADDDAWTLDVHDSAPAPTVDPGPPAVEQRLNVHGVRITATFRVPAQAGIAHLPATARVELTGPAGLVVASDTVVDAAAPEVPVTLDAQWLTHGATYTATIRLETNRGAVATKTYTFTYALPASFLPAGGAPVHPAPGDLPGDAVILAPPATSATPRRAAVARLRVGTARRDVLTGTAAGETLRGLGGADRIDGRGGDDRLDGGTGADRLTGGAGRDTISGGAGDDVVDARDGRADTVACGPGRDRVIADRSDRLSGCERASRPGSRR